MLTIYSSKDITPPGITAWLRHPVDRVHVLLDRKGKTLSHVFVEITGEEAAKAALRTAQNSVLGKGKRARGVTLTRSSQEELMKAVSLSHRERSECN
jgi:site-specific recombinase XerC